MPERGALRVGLRCRLDLAEENEGPLAAVERRLAVPCRPRCARELPRVEIDRRVRVDRIEMQVMESRRGEHGHLAHVGSDHYSSIRTTARGSWRQTGRLPVASFHQKAQASSESL